MRVEPQQLKAFLLDAGLVTEKQFGQALNKSQKSGQEVGKVLVSMGLLGEKELIKMEAYILGIPFINLENEKIDSEILSIIPEPLARSHNIIAYRIGENTLEVAMLDPEDLETIEFIKKKKSGLRILPRLTNPEGIKNALKQYRKTLKAEFGEIIKKEEKSFKKEGAKGLKKAAAETPIIKILDTLVKHAILERASDIHIEPAKKEIIARYRIDGILHDAMTLPKKIASSLVARVKVLSNLKLDENRLPQDGRFKFEKEGYKYSIRVSILPTFNGEKVVMRLLQESGQALNLEELGLRDEALERVQINLRKSEGMLLISGPTGCGKTTTLYSMLEILNTPEVNISTVEDPIEYQMPRVNQTQIKPKIGLTFASGLRALVRQDPDIIMVGEIRDKETAGLAINAALTGHLVLSTLHTTSASGAIPRLIDMGAEPFLISSTLNLIIAQRLVRKLYKMKEKYKLSENQLKELGKYCNISKITDLLKKEKIINQSQKLEDVYFYKPKKSKNCPDGYQGRIGIFEVLPVTETIKELIIKQVPSDNIEKQAKKEGMRTMIEDGFLKAAQGITSIEEVLRVVIE
jgi:type IV pilus assembly protein PilB